MPDSSLPTLYGCDVSKWNRVNWPWLRGVVGFVGYRASWGVRGVDPMRAAHLAGAVSIGALPIAYHVRACGGARA